MSAREHYVYVIFRPNGIPCYVGKGKGERWLKHERGSHNPHLAAIIAKAGGSVPKIKIREHLTDKEAIETEIAFIKAIGRECNGGPLVNLTDGGDGTAGAKMSSEWRARRSKKAAEAWNDPEYRIIQISKKAGNQNSKKPHTLTDEWRSELTNRMLGNKFSVGMKHSDSAREKMSAKWKDEEWRKAVMESRRESEMYSPAAAARRAALRAINNPERYGPKPLKVKVPRVYPTGADHYWHGRTHRESTKEKLSKQRSGTGNTMYGRRGADCPRSRSVLCVTDGQVFITLTDAAAWLRSNGYSKASVGNISACCLGKIKTAYGRVWQYADSKRE